MTEENPIDKRLTAAIKRIRWPTTPELDELIEQFAREFSQLYFDCYGEKMEQVDVEEFAKMIEVKLCETNGID
jgi:hypothetical protein